MGCIVQEFQHNENKVNKGYTKGEKIFIKINQTSGGEDLIRHKEKGDTITHPYTCKCPGVLF